MERGNTESIMEALTSDRHNKVTRVDTSTGILAFPKLLYAPDGDGEQNLVMNGAEDVNHQTEVEGPGLPEEPTQPLDHPIDSLFEHEIPDQIRRIFMQNDGHRNPLLTNEVMDHLGDNLLGQPTTADWIEYLVKQGPAIVRDPKSCPGVQTARILRKLGAEMRVLPPGNDDDQGDWRDKARWATYLSALVAELMMVEGGCSSQVRDAGVFVVTRFQYPELLELLAQEVLLAHAHPLN